MNTIEVFNENDHLKTIQMAMRWNFSTEKKALRIFPVSRICLCNKDPCDLWPHT